MRRYEYWYGVIGMLLIGLYFSVECLILLEISL